MPNVGHGDRDREDHQQIIPAKAPVLPPLPPKAKSPHRHKDRQGHKGCCRSLCPPCVRLHSEVGFRRCRSTRAEWQLGIAAEVGAIRFQSRSNEGIPRGGRRISQECGSGHRGAWGIMGGRAYRKRVDEETTTMCNMPDPSVYQTSRSGYRWRGRARCSQSPKGSVSGAAVMTPELRVPAAWSWIMRPQRSPTKRASRAVCISFFKTAPSLEQC